MTANTAASGGSGSKEQVDFVSIHHFPEEIQTDLIQVSSSQFTVWGSELLQMLSIMFSEIFTTEGSGRLATGLGLL